VTSALGAAAARALADGRRDRGDLALAAGRRFMRPF
jgi:hypothetical protein